MNRLLVNIRGCNGAGKSTIPISMMDDPEMYVVTKKYQGKDRKILTIFPTYGWIALGSYHNKTGGMDGFPDKVITQKALWYALKHFPNYSILMEGVLASTVYSTYSEMFKKAEKEFGVTVVILNFLPPFETCLERVYQRNGGKPIKEEAVLTKWKTVNRNVEKFKADGFYSIKIDNSRTPKESMLVKFLKFIEKYKEV